jgi:glyoxylase-like metal-dependent hydrolase (beta-lactamase superfamily II)
MKKWITNNTSLEVIKLPLRRSGCYLVSDKDHTVLVDTGTKSSPPKILRSVKRLHKKVDAIVLTHAHFDHAGGAEYLRQQFSCEVYAHPSEIQALRRGFADLPNGAVAFVTQAVNVVKKNAVKLAFLHYIPVRDVKGLKVGLFGMKIQFLHTPGHTEGSISVIVDGDIALVGDAMIHQMAMLFPPFANAPEKIKSTWKALLGTGCRLFHPSHGGGVNAGRLTRQLAKLETKS